MTTFVHIPEDMTATVAADMPLVALQAQLGARGQWLPIDPPLGTSPTIRALLDGNLTGPRRFGYGTVRDYVLGLRVQLADGPTIRAGGQVVKNVAGYDLCRLFVGARGTLGTIIEVTFKLRPLPERTQLVQLRHGSIDEAATTINAVLDSPITPVVLDLVSPATVILGFEGAREDVDWQVTQAAQLGFIEPAAFDYDRVFPNAVSVLPSRLIEMIRAIGPDDFVARAGNGLLNYRGGQPPSPTAEPAAVLQRRVKEMYDPAHKLPG